MTNKKCAVVVLAMLSIAIVAVPLAHRRGYRKGSNEAYKLYFKDNPRVDLNFCLANVERSRHDGYQRSHSTARSSRELADWLIANEQEAEKDDAICETQYRKAKSVP